MADTGAAQPPPPPLRAPAAVPETLRRLLALVTDVLVCCFLAAMWVTPAASAAAAFSRWACGEGSPAADVAAKVSVASFLATAALAPFASPVVTWRLLGRPRRGGRARERGRGDVTGERRRRQEGGLGRVVQFALFSVCFAVVGLLLQELAPEEKGSIQEKVGSVLADIGLFANSVMICFVVAPNLLIFLARDRWR
ncbi:hypothetical protein OsI_29259 [Oryza sativa Indica Group]|uniref:Uncharacterized protein n=2 Tax=Oryza TaxID=4527 RepID=A0A0E0IBX5_ORYNI|nr:hypothetical protein OsI_29259 [Oryza sativa Indica Group]